QMKGRGTRTIELDDLKKVTPTAKFTKDHFVIVDAIGVTKSLKTDSRPLEKKPGVSLKDLLGAIAVGARDEDLFSTLANRLIRLEKQITDKEKERFIEKSGGKSINEVAKGLIKSFDPDILEELRHKTAKDFENEPVFSQIERFKERALKMQDEAASVFTGELNEYIENVRKVHAQIIDTLNPDELISADWDKENFEKAQSVIDDFSEWIKKHRDEITALQIFYDQPYRRRELTYKMIKDLFEIFKTENPSLAPFSVWKAYEQLEKVNGTPKNELIALVSLIRKVAGIDEKLTAYDKTVDRNFQDWVFKKQAGTLKFNEEQMQWLRMIKEFVAMSFHIEKEDFDLDPFNKNGGLHRFYKVFGDKYHEIIDELNEVLAA
ncbi:MAG TPA: type I restriction-modification enzyme R subunit C-terminal domain-containing protein, partial [bacterium]|nr:type I restriction-modification enzyme R subunit C-terminal domain-containing protein [bacterium]